MTLPDWFEALNRDFRYQLTAIGAPGPDLYVAEEVGEQSLQDRRRWPRQKVSWQVTGIRQRRVGEHAPHPGRGTEAGNERGTSTCTHRRAAVSDARVPRRFQFTA